MDHMQDGNLFWDVRVELSCGDICLLSLFGSALLCLVYTFEFSMDSRKSTDWTVSNNSHSSRNVILGCTSGIVLWRYLSSEDVLT